MCVQYLYLLRILAIHNPHAFNLVFGSFLPWIIIYKISFCKYNEILLALHSVHGQYQQQQRILQKIRAHSHNIAYSFFPSPLIALCSLSRFSFFFVVEFCFQQHMALATYVPAPFISSFNINNGHFRLEIFFHSLLLRFNLFISISYLSACNCPYFDIASRTENNVTNDTQEKWQQTNKYWILFVMYTQALDMGHSVMTTYHKTDSNNSGKCSKSSNIFNSIIFYSLCLSIASFRTYKHRALLFMYHKYFDQNTLYTTEKQVLQRQLQPKKNIAQKSYRIEKNK